MQTLLFFGFMILCSVSARKHSNDYQELLELDVRLAGGTNTTMPIRYIAQVQPLAQDGSKMTMCGGAIINTTLILTTASCMFGSKTGTVMAGSPDPAATTADPKAQFSNNSQIFYHPKFFQNTRANDIAILRIDPPFNTTATVDMIKLAKSSMARSDSLANKTVVWTSFGKKKTSVNAPALQLAMLKPIKSKSCTNFFRKGPNFVMVPKTTMCMEVTATTGICPGDLGSPIVYFNLKDKKNPNVPYLVALASWNHDMQCPPNTTNKFNSPDWFTRLEPFHKWIYEMGGPKQS